VEADARGRTGHGLIRLGPYIGRIQAGGVNLDPAIEVLHETPTSALIDGDTVMRILWVYGATDVTRTFTETGETVSNHGTPTLS
jgi:L-2-hydroxycarboxylate dehydrogenase (NAD+)